MIRQFLARRRRRPMTLEEYRAYRDREWCERVRQMEQEPPP